MLAGSPLGACFSFFEKLNDSEETKNHYFSFNRAAASYRRSHPTSKLRKQNLESLFATFGSIGVDTPIGALPALMLNRVAISHSMTHIEWNFQAGVFAHFVLVSLALAYIFYSENRIDNNLAIETPTWVWPPSISQAAFAVFASPLFVLHGAGLAEQWYTGTTISSRTFVLVAGVMPFVHIVYTTYGFAFCGVWQAVVAFIVGTEDPFILTVALFAIAVWLGGWS